MKKSSSNAVNYHQLIYIFFGCYIYYYFTSISIFTEPDIAWIIPTGQLIRENFSVPIYDSFSFLSPELNYKWYNASWLWCVFVSLIHDWFGPASLYIASVLIQSSSITFLAYTLLKRGLNPHLVFTLAFINAIVLGHFSGLRPHMATYVLAVGFIYILDRAKNNNKYLYALPPLMALWVNTHWGFIAGFVLIGAFVLEALIEKNKKFLKNLILTGLAGGFFLLINPYGIYIFEAFINHFSRVSSSAIIEWQPLSFGILFGIDLLFITVLFSSNFLNKKIPLSDKIISAFWIIAAISNIRNAMILGGISAYFIGKNLELFLKPEILEKAKNKKYKPVISLFFAFLIVLSIAFPANILIKELSTKEQDKITKESLVFGNSAPINAIKFIEKNYSNTRILNHFSYGGYITYFSGRKVKNFTDGRFVTAFPEEITSKVIKFYNFDAGYSEKDFYKFIAEYKIEGLFFPNEYIKLIPALDRNWKKVYSDGLASVYILKK